MFYDHEHDYGLVRINARQYRKCDKHCCNAKIGKRSCYCWTCRESEPRNKNGE